MILALLRITTNARVFEKPLAIETAIDYMDDWLNRPVLITVVPGRGHWKILRSLLARTGTGGNLTSDAHIAALALEHGGTVYSADNDFKRFPGLIHFNPLDD